MCRPGSTLCPHASVDGGSVDAEREQQRQTQGARVRREVASTLRRQSVTRPADPTISLDGEADIISCKTSATVKVTDAMTREGTSARTATEEDFGESRMGPVSDPTEGHDTQLDGLTVPEVDLQAQVEASTRDRIATAGNVATLSLDEAVVVRESTMTQVNALAEQRGQRKREIRRGIRRSESSFTRLCSDGETARQRIRTATEGEATQRRQTWRVAAESHVTTRQGEATTLVREKTEHAQQLADDADRDAATTLDDAHTEATRQSQEVENRARAKGQQSQSRSWWRQTIDWVEAKIDDLIVWIDGFIDEAHRAIDVLLDKASDVAHGIVQAGRTAVRGALDLAHRGVDAIADNLPGELGALAREHRDTMHAFLDRQQEAVDAYADGLHEDIDTAIEETREDLHEGLENFRDGVHDVANDVKDGLDVARNGIMALIRQLFPSVAAFIDEGILGPINRAGDALHEWAQTALQASGLDSVQSALQDMHASRFCQARTEQEQAEDCKAFKLRLEGLKTEFDALLASPVAQQIQGILQESRDEAASQQVDAVSGFFSFIQWVARPVYEWWQSVQPQLSAALEMFEDMAQTAWEFVASALGLDISLPPLEAIRQALERAWEAISAAAQPLIAQLQQAYQWLIEDSPLAPIIAFFAALPEAISALGQLLGQMTDTAGAWLAEAAETLKNTIMPVVNRVLGLVSRAINAVVARVVGWADRLLGAFDALMQWEAAHALLQAVITVIQAFATPIRLAIQVFRDCGERALRALADVIANLAQYARTILDVVVGIVQAIVGFPLLTVAFFVGNVWRFLIPECYKAPILNFMLDLAIRTVQFFPEPADFMWAALYQGLLGFLQGLRAAPDEQKVGAIDLLASIMGGNAEVAAGFAVGLVEGVWEATGGTIIFLIQAVAWIVALPFKLIRWAAGLVGGQGPGRARSEGDDTPAEQDEDTAEPAEQGVAVGRRVEGLERTIQGRARGPPSRETIRQAEALDRSGELDQDVPVAEPDVALDDEAPVVAGTDVGAIEQAGTEAESNAAVPADEGGVSEGGGGEAAQTAEPERPPAIPEAIAGMRSTFEQLMASGFTRQDVMTALDGVRDTMRGFIGRLAEEAAGSMLGAANASGAGFAIGRVMGSIVGQLVVEAILAFFTGGASAGLTAAKAALTGARAAGRLASVLRRVRRAVQPLLNAMSRLR
ncbi:MAG: hypothetical protein JKY37_07525, partial [Nannocystaceae bacterium]|nr:hypothetical protein [Nannocystaceae bacterium]